MIELPIMHLSENYEMLDITKHPCLQNNGTEKNVITIIADYE